MSGFLKFTGQEDPNMPGALQVEALTQMGALTILTLDGNKGKLIYVVAADKVRYKKLSQGDELYIETQLISWKRGMGIVKAESFVDNKPACSGIFTLVLTEEFQRVRNK